MKNDSHEKNLKELELKYETLEKETENKELALKNQILQQRNKYFLFGLLGSILLLGFVLFANYKVKKANRVIEAQRDELESTNQTKDRLFSIIGHDLRKPILGIQGIGKKLAYLNEKGDQELLNKLLRSVDQNSQNLMILINNLLSWTKFQKSYRTIELSSFNIGDLVEENHQFFDLRLAEKNLKFEVIGRPFDVHSNSDALSTIVRNIIDNSIKYSKEGDLIELLFAEEDNQKKMSLKDKGKGMDAEQLRNLKLGKRINSEKGTHGEMGVGLGWQIIYDLSRRLNIDVDIKSEINRGTTIELTFN